MNTTPGLLQDLKVSDLRAQIEAAAKQMISRRSPEYEAHKSERTALLFTGSFHTTVPRALLFSTEISANEKTVWQIMRTMINGSGHGVDAPYRAEIAVSVPCTEATVTKSRQLLRLTRWLTLGQHVRDHNGRMMGDIYLMHEEQWPIWETIQVDMEYVMFVEEIANSESSRYPKSAKESARKILTQISNLSEPKEQTLFGLIQNRIETRDSKTLNHIKNFDPVPNHHIKNFDPVPNHHIKNFDPVPNHHIKNFDPVPNHHIKNFDPVPNHHIKNFDPVSSSSFININKTTTTTTTTVSKNSKSTDTSFRDELDDYRVIFAKQFPEIENTRFLNEIADSFYVNGQAPVTISKQMINKLDESQDRLILVCQIVGKIWAARQGLCDPIRNLPSYVNELVRRYQKGTFNLDEYGLDVKGALDKDDPSCLIRLKKNWAEL